MERRERGNRIFAIRLFERPEPNRWEEGVGGGVLLFKKFDAKSLPERYYWRGLKFQRYRATEPP